MSDVLKDLGLTEEQFRNILPTLPQDQARELLALIEQKQEHLTKNRIDLFSPYDYQKKFFDAGSKYRARFLCAANRIGKTFGGAVEMTYHITGQYPTMETHGWEWEGKRFNTGILGWCLGITGDSTKRVLQKELFGTEDARMEMLIGTGSIPASAIISVEKDGGRIVSAKIKHAPDGFEGWTNTLRNVSTVEFRSTEQGEHTLMGPAVHVIWADEEHPRHSQTLFAQCITRTATTDGIVYITATPENGLTPLIAEFSEKEELYYQNATWADAPHLTAKAQEELLAAYPEWQRDMRSKGIPVLGSGLVYNVAKEVYECEPFSIPKHYLQLGAIDFGYGHPTVFSKLAYDVENDIIYLTYQQDWVEKTPTEIAPALKLVAGGIDITWPHDGNTSSKDTGVTLAARYKNLGVNFQEDHFRNPEGGLSVEEGVVEILERMRDGRFKVFSTCSDFFLGAQRYQRKSGEINKGAFDFDHGDSARYGLMRLVAGDGTNAIDLAQGNNQSWLSDRSTGSFGAGAMSNVTHSDF